MSESRDKLRTIIGWLTADPSLWDRLIAVWDVIRPEPAQPELSSPLTLRAATNAPEDSPTSPVAEQPKKKKRMRNIGFTARALRLLANGALNAERMSKLMGMEYTDFERNMWYLRHTGDVATLNEGKAMTYSLTERGRAHAKPYVDHPDRLNIKQSLEYKNGK